jgi:hypothetical protein
MFQIAAQFIPSDSDQLRKTDLLVFEGAKLRRYCTTAVVVVVDAKRKALGR